MFVVLIYLSFQTRKFFLKLQTQNTEHGTRNVEHETRNTERRTGTRNKEHGTKNTEHETRNAERGTRNAFYHSLKLLKRYSIH